MSKHLAQNDIENDVKIDILTSCTRLYYTPSYKTEISRMGEIHRKPCRVCNNNHSHSTLFELYLALSELAHVFNRTDKEGI